MMDIFHEFIVKKKKDTTDILLTVGIIFAAIVLTFVLLFVTMAVNMQMQVVGGIGFVLIFLMWWGAKNLISSRNIEYEYILTNSELDIDKIIGRRGRKRLLTVNFREIERCASIRDEKYSYEYNNPGSRSIKNYAGDTDAGRVYFVDFTKDSEPMRVIFQPNERILEGIKKVNPRCVEIKEGDV